MNSPVRVVRFWFNHLRMRELVRSVEWQLSVVLKRGVTLVPRRSGGGFDSIYYARTARPPRRFVASVRINCPWTTAVADEPQLPRQVLNGPQRILREAAAYRVLSAERLAPALLVQSDTWLANEWLPWQRWSDVLRHDDQLLWTTLTTVLRTVRQMHERDVVHMDLNCGNVILAPDAAAVNLIDFEYEPATELSPSDCQTFDVLRMIHNLLKPRRGRELILADPLRFANLVEPFLPPSAQELLTRRGAEWFVRITEFPELVPQSSTAVRSPAWPLRSAA